MIQVTGTQSGRKFYFPFDMISFMSEVEYDNKSGTAVYMREGFRGESGLNVYHVVETPEEIIMMAEFNECC